MHQILGKSSKYLYKDDFDNFISYEKFIDEAKIVGKLATINLGFDPVLTRPWNEKRLVNAFSNIGRGKRGGEWTEEENHEAELGLLFGITFVSSGNHSITAGILNNEGQLKINSIYDMSKIFPYIYCDGVNYFRKREDSLYAPVRNYSLVVVFEIGRLINEQRNSGNSI
ncbi:DUF6710 family protein [Aneurinibacillus migulanus]|uniref:DUF6710 family protein n=2 Tax=Aneurinibacillus migulanus TaxID=47500 RepID=UPI0006978475|nr:DUF6710 family protein [Aneurinibacillus migulanus]